LLRKIESELCAGAAAAIWMHIVKRGRTRALDARVADRRVLLRAMCTSCISESCTAAQQQFQGYVRWVAPCVPQLLVSKHKDIRTQLHGGRGWAGVAGGPAASHTFALQQRGAARKQRTLAAPLSPTLPSAAPTKAHAQFCTLPLRRDDAEPELYTPVCLPPLSGVLCSPANASCAGARTLQRSAGVGGLCVGHAGGPGPQAAQASRRQAGQGKHKQEDKASRGVRGVRACVYMCLYVCFGACVHVCVLQHAAQRRVLMPAGLRLAAGSAAHSPFGWVVNSLGKLHKLPRARSITTTGSVPLVWMDSYDAVSGLDRRIQIHVSD